MLACLEISTPAGRLAPRRWRTASFWLLACVVAWLVLAAPAFANLQPIPALQQRVTDTTDTLNAETQTRLTQALAELEQRKGAQIAVLMVPTTGDEDISLYAVRAFEQWKLGREAVDDGILFLIAKDDRRLRIEVGYGLEGAVPDLLAGRIIREQVAPHFQQGDFAGGVEAGVDSLINLVDGEDLPPPVEQPEDDDTFATIMVLVFLALMMPPVISVLGTGVFTFLLFDSAVIAVLAAMGALLLSLAGRSWLSRGGGASASRRGGAIGTMGGIGGGWSGRGGGGFGGGGFGGGGFGGGGGSSGGGGASGSW